MSEIRVGEGESLESALKRFKRKTARAGIMQEARSTSIMKNRAYVARKKLKLRKNANIEHNGCWKFPAAFCFSGVLRIGVCGAL